MKLKHTLLSLVVTLVCSSCNYLEFDETNGLNTKEYIYNYFNKTKQMLTNVYSYMPQDFGAISGAIIVIAVLLQNYQAIRNNGKLG